MIHNLILHHRRILVDCVRLFKDKIGPENFTWLQRFSFGEEDFRELLWTNNRDLPFFRYSNSIPAVIISFDQADHVNKILCSQNAGSFCLHEIFVLRIFLDNPSHNDFSDLVLEVHSAGLVIFMRHF